MPRPEGSDEESTPPRPGEPGDLAIHPDWWQSAEVKRAIDLSGWPECTTVDLLQALALVLDTVDRAREQLRELLHQRGMTVGQFLELLADARANGLEFNGKGLAASRAVRRLWLAGFEVDQIADLLNFDPTLVASSLAKGNIAESGRTVLELHNQGMSPNQIAAKTGLDRQNVYRLLETCELRPHRSRIASTVSARRAVVDLYREGLLSYAEIADRTGLSTDTVKNACRRAHKLGQLPEYGTRAR